MLLYSLKIGNLPEAMKCLKALIADVPYSNKKLASMDMDVSLPTNIKSTIMKYPIGIQSFEQINREILKGFYSVFKLADKHLQFVLLTGVTKFSQVSVFSGFNQPKDISYDARFDALCGITKDELITVFKDQIKELGDANGMTEEQAIAKLKRKYDGYHFSKQKNDIFNRMRKLGVVWLQPCRPTILVIRIVHIHGSTMSATRWKLVTLRSLSFSSPASLPTSPTVSSASRMAESVSVISSTPSISLCRCLADTTLM